MNKFYKLSIVLVFLLISGSFAQSDVFNRGHLIPVPVEENTGFGEFIAGVDFDGDGLKEIYAVNNMLDQGGAELIPRIYKFEFDGTTWDSVWSATITDIPQQNSWAALTYGDLDKDGKMEIIWGPANNFSSENVNPPRILVFESAGDGSNALGVDIFGNYKPNCQWTITEENNKEVRPFVWTVEDIDSDGVMEICFADRQQNYWFGVVSVSDVPDFADGSETWTLEHSGVNSGIHASTLYDLAVIDNAMYLFHSDGWVSIVEYAGGSWKAPVSLEAKVPGGSWKGAQAVDVNGDGVKEILVGGWTSGNNNVYLLEPDPFEVLRSRTIANLSSHIGSLGRFNGSTFGDIDLDKKMDLVFGTRGATPNGAILRMEYQSGDIADSSSYIFTVIDSLISDLSTQRFDIVNIANVDADDELEVLYTDGNQTGLIPIVVLKIDIAISVEDYFIPAQFFLDQNYPNPFNPTTTIRFGLSEESIVDLRIFDILGREVAILINSELKSAATYNLTFNASDLASGTYVYKLNVNGNSLSRKMLLIK